MNSPNIMYALRWLIRDTFRQALASKIFWIMLVVSGVCIVFCLGVSIEGGGNLQPELKYGDRTFYHPTTGKPVDAPPTDLGKMHLLFGAVKADLHRDAQHQVHMLHVFFGTWVAGAMGLLLALVWTAGFLPEFLQPANAAVLFAKPVPRWLFLVGKYIGVVLFVAFQSSVFFLGTWLALGVKTNVWLEGYLTGIPILVVHFASIYSFTVLLAVLTRSTVACVLGGMLFWVVCMGANYGHHVAAALPTLAPQAQAIPSFTMFFIDASYWILPKPTDLILILEESLNASAHMMTLNSMPEFQVAAKVGAYEPGASIFTSLLFSAVLLTISGRQLGKTDY